MSGPRSLGRVAVAGSPRGQLFHELLRSCPDGVEFIALQGEAGERLDIRDAGAVRAAVERARPDAVINAAAWTAVDQAESDAEAAHAVNADGAEHLARAAAALDAHVVHVSTDFVFGPGDGTPFATDAATAPLSVYGQSKLAGEQRVRAAATTASIVRTAWVYSAHGNNFVKTMLRLMRERDTLSVVADQTGSPTWANALARALWRAAERRVDGTLHWTGAGSATWHDFACAIHDEGRRVGLLERNVEIAPVTTADYPTPAARPAYSVLSLDSSIAALDLTPAPWRTDLIDMLGELA